MSTEAGPNPGTDIQPPKRRLRALAFAGGAFDTIMQMGVVHALLVSRSKAPDYVVGISAGAVNAAALAEVMQEGQGENLSRKDRLIARVRRLRLFLDTYLELPRMFGNSSLPDAFEVNAKRPLRPLELPVHLPNERKSRADAVRSKAGLIRLLNHLLGIRLTVAAAARMLRRILALVQAEELPRPLRPGDTILVNSFFLWLLSLRWISALSEVLAALLNGALCGRHGSLLQMVWSCTPRIAAFFQLKRLSERLEKGLRSDAATAGEAIQHGVRNLLNGGIRRLFGLALFVALWLVPLLVLSPSQEVVDLFLRSVEHRIRAEVVIHEVSRVLATLYELPSATNEAFFDNLVRAWDALAGVAGSVAIYTRSLVYFHRVTILGLVVPFVIAMLIEMFTRLRWAVMFLVIWISQVVLFDTLYPDRPFRQRDHSRIAIVLGLTVLGVVAYSLRSTARRRLLEYYEIGDGLLSADVLRQHLVHCFDENYHGKASIDSIIQAALKRAPEVDGKLPDTKARLGKYWAPGADPPIHVAPVAANIKDGYLEIVNGQVPVVDALLAATAVVPLFPPQDVDPEPEKRKFSDLLRFLARKGRRAPEEERTWYIDGLNVSNEPIQPLFRHLRKAYDADPARFDDVETVDIYPVSDVPVDEPRLTQEGEYSTLVEVGLRALELKQFRDAAVERRLTRLYTRALPADRAFHHVIRDDADGPDAEDRTFVHADLYPIELEKPARVNRRLFRGAAPDDFKRILRETVADGCRASLEAMLPGSIFTGDAVQDLLEWVADLEKLSSTDEAKTVRPTKDVLDAIRSSARFPNNVVDAESSAVLRRRGFAMRFAVAENDVHELVVHPRHVARLKEIIFPRCIDVISSVLKEPTLPGSDQKKAPGLSEICRHCRLNRPPEGSEEAAKPDPFNQQRLRLIPSRTQWPEWPLEDDTDRRVDAPPRRGVRRQRRERRPAASWDPSLYAGWPLDRNRPVVSFLFGGGVFRGVFHMGVMNALNEAGIEPDIVAGSSVGSIVAAMIASAFKTTNADERHRRIAALAATFLAIDKLVLTDRLSDFVRRFTLRAAEAQFSPRDIDRALRQFDTDSPAHFNRRARKVLAGLERLFYFSPFELYEVLRDARMQKMSRLTTTLIQDLQELLERGGLGQEILGSESLSLLIQRHVIDSVRNGNTQPEFQSFLKGDRKIFFLATATNLVEGGLNVLGAPWSESPEVLLEQGLLASSAFPAVFRPRQSWEIFSNTNRDDKYVDGGTIDNLPLDAVARFLSRAAKAGAITKRHDVPHLLFTASLEVNPSVHGESQKDLRRHARDCLALMRRAGTFKYNRKIDAYASVQRRLRAIYRSFGKVQGWEPLNLHVLAVKPNWLCGTFGFHPMLGFRRRKQAQSIAHGCASTLGTLHLGSKRQRKWFTEWSSKDLDFSDRALTKVGSRIELHPQKRNPDSGLCWFRDSSDDRKHICPFSRAGTDTLNDRLPAAQRLSAVEIDELHEIYVTCGDAATHRPER